MKCPKCKTAVTTAPDASGLIICAKCGARLRSRASVEKAAATAGKAAAAEAAPRTGSETVAAPGAAVRVGSDTLPAGLPVGVATLPPGNLKRPPEDDQPTVPHGLAAAPVSEVPPSPAPPAVPVPEGMEPLFQELRALRAGQDEILALLKRGVASSPEAPAEDIVPAAVLEDAVAAAVPAVRSRRRKTVLVIDDDPSTRIAALQAFEHAEVPTRTAQDGNAGLAAIAEEKPDVIVLELGVGGDMSGKDVVNMIKATMEWVDIPIVLYTRMPIDGQKEARTIHGADELVPKGPDGPNQLVARVIGLFRKG